MPHEDHEGEPARVRSEAAETVAGVLAAIEQVIQHARSVPMSASVLVGREELLDLVRQATAALPAELSRADDVLARGDDVLAQARSRAEEILADADRRAERMVGAQEVTIAARARADEIVAEARQVAEEMKREADDYCDRRLADFEIDLGKVLAQVQAGRAKLAGRLGDE